MRSAQIEMSDVEFQAFHQVSKSVLFALVRDYANQIAGTIDDAGDGWIKEASERCETLADNNIIPKRCANVLKVNVDAERLFRRKAVKP